MFVDKYGNIIAHQIQLSKELFVNIIIDAPQYGEVGYISTGCKNTGNYHSLPDGEYHPGEIINWINRKELEKLLREYKRGI